MNEEIKKSLDDFFSAMKSLRELGMLINNKDFTGQLGEWLVEMIYEGKRATSGIQKDWDVDVKGKHIQVKAHAKAERTTAKWSSINKNPSEKVDELIILVFSFDYKLKELYKVPWHQANQYIKLSGKKQPSYTIKLSSIKSYKIEITDLPHQEIVSLFI